jgi:hypothetical protein
VLAVVSRKSVGESPTDQLDFSVGPTLQVLTMMARFGMDSMDGNLRVEFNLLCRIPAIDGFLSSACLYG